MLKKISFPLVILGISLFFGCQNTLLEDSSALNLEQPVTESRLALNSTAPVILEYARISWTRDAQGQRWTQLQGIANLKNLSYQKKLTLHLGTSQSFGPMTWQDVPGTYLGPSTNGYEQWKFESPKVQTSSLVTYQWALKAEIGGAVYWDNHGGKDYSARAGFNEGRIYDGNHGVLNNGPITLDKPDGVYNGTGGVDAQFRLLVKNLAYQKKVTLVYTLDAWKTTQKATAAYQESLGDNVEAWQVQGVNIPAGIRKVQYALCLETASGTYWDNNLNKNYTWDFDLGDF